MKATIFQSDILWRDTETNLQRADKAVDSNPGSDLYVFPEMFSIGFCVEPEGVAESADGETLAWMRGKAAEINSAIAGSVPV